MFRSLSGVNFRIWFAGALVSNVGTWMQRTAQDWIVLTELTDHDAVAVGVVMALQFGPQLLLMPWTGLIADRFDRRKLLIATQVALTLLGLGLGLILIFGIAELWHVYAFALALGIVSAIDAPARQAFVSELVSDKDLTNAVALNSASFNAARLLGPAVAGLLVVVVGAGWVFVINAISYLASLISLMLLHRDKLHDAPRAERASGQLIEGFRYVARRTDIVMIMIVIFLIGTFGLNFPIFTATMASVEFHRGAGEFGILSSVLAIGSVAGALLAARRERPRIRTVFISAAAFGAACVLSALMPSYETFAASLVLVGYSSITLMTTANSTVQTTTSPLMRGRVMALYLAIFVGGTPIGAPVVGWVSNTYGPRWALGVGAASGFVAAAIGLIWMVTQHELRLRYDRRLKLRFFVSHDGNSRRKAVEDLSMDENIARRS